MRFVAILIVMLMLTGCASYLPVGTIYTDSKMGVQAGNGATGKTGKACVTSILGLIATGDASVEAAKAEGGVTEVTNINYEASNILGIYGKYCLIVQGR